jgi:hypothetical protein
MGNYRCYAKDSLSARADSCIMPTALSEKGVTGAAPLCRAGLNICRNVLKAYRYLAGGGGKRIINRHS